MKIAMAVSLIIIAGVCLIAYLSVWSAIDDIKESLDYIKRECNNGYEIKQTEYILHEYITGAHKDLLTEIACLATKNNEDIKRMKGGFAVGDILRFDGTRWRVYSKATVDNGKTLWKLFGENGEDCCIYTNDMPVDLEFLGHRDLSFD